MIGAGGVSLETLTTEGAKQDRHAPFVAPRSQRCRDRPRRYTCAMENPSKASRPPQLTIKTEDGVWRSPATTGGDVVRKDMDFELAKKLTSLMINNIDAVKSKGIFMAHVAVGEIDPAVTGMCGPNPIKYHPGAVAAWEEAGHKVPDCARP